MARHLKLDTLPMYNYCSCGNIGRVCIDCGETTKCGVMKYKVFVPLCEECAMHRDVDCEAGIDLHG